MIGLDRHQIPCSYGHSSTVTSDNATTNELTADPDAGVEPEKAPVESLVHLSRSCRKSLEHLVRHISQVKAFRAAAQQPYVRTVDSNGETKLLFCDTTGNNASSVMAVERFRAEQKKDPSRFSKIAWYQSEVSVKDIEKGTNQISMVGAVGQTLHEPGTRRPLTVWTQLANERSNHTRVPTPPRRCWHALGDSNVHF